MLTNNYKLFVNRSLNYKSNVAGWGKNLININGTTVKIDYNPNNGTFINGVFGAYTLEDLENNKTNKSYSSIFIGTGTNDERLEDFTLESIIPDSDLVINGANDSFSEGKFFFTKTFTYIGVNEITINEIAFYKSLYDGLTPHTFCLARQLIKPLTVSNGDTFTVTMVIG